MAVLPFNGERASKILKQVEFYFSDSNLPRDKFLLRCVQEGQDGLVSLPLICTFSRMRSHLGLSNGSDKIPAESIAAVAEILRKSATLIVSEDGQKVRRSSKLADPEEIRVAVDACTVAAGPLRWNVKTEEIQSFFSNHAKVNSIRLPRHVSAQAFCGYALIEFSSLEEVRRIQELKLEFEGAALEYKTRKAFDEEMESLRKQQHMLAYQEWKNSTVELPVNHSQVNGRNGRDRPRVLDYPKGVIVGFSLKKKSANTGTESAIKEEAITSEQPEVKSVTPSSEEEHLSRDDIKDVTQKFGLIKYVDYKSGEMSGYLRFDSPEGAQKIRTAAVLADDGGLIIKDYIATFEAIEGNKEMEYWSKLQGLQDKRWERQETGDRGPQNRQRGRWGNGSFRGRGQARGWGRGRGSQDDNSEPHTNGNRHRSDSGKNDALEEHSPPSKLRKLNETESKTMQGSAELNLQ